MLLIFLGFSILFGVKLEVLFDLYYAILSLGFPISVINGFIKGYIFNSYKIKIKIIHIFVGLLFIFTLYNINISSVMISVITVGLSKWLFSEDSLKYYQYLKKDNLESSELKIEIPYETKLLWAYRTTQVSLISYSLSASYVIKSILPGGFKVWFLQNLKQFLFNLYGEKSFISDDPFIDATLISAMIFMTFIIIYSYLIYLLNTGGKDTLIGKYIMEQRDLLNIKKN